MRRTGPAALALVAMAAAPAATAQVAHPMATTTDPADRAVMEEVASAIATRSPDIARLNALLAKLPRPTPMRGMVQTVRAGLLARQQDAGPAVAAIEEALRLLPDDPRPKLVAAGIFTFSGSPQRAADLWLQASRESPDIARMSDRYVMDALAGRLTDIGDRARADRVRARLNEIGFSSGLAPERSSAALARTREAMRAGRIEEALGTITAIGNPDDLLTLYVDDRYTPLWPRIAEWAGADLAIQSARYLAELRADWTAAQDVASAVPYARELANLQGHAAVVGLFLPLFERPLAESDTDDALFLAPIVARSLDALGRAGEARTLLAKVATIAPANGSGNTLNIDGAYLSLAANAMDWGAVLTRADAFLARAATLGGSINRSAVVTVAAWRACALSRSGRAEEAQRAAAEVLMTAAVAPGPALQLHLCRGDVAAARALLIARLADESTRSWALRAVQPVTGTITVPLHRVMKPAAQAARTAADVVAAASKVGRILPQPVNATVPPGFDPFRARPRARPPAPGET